MYQLPYWSEIRIQHSWKLLFFFLFNTQLLRIVPRAVLRSDGTPGESLNWCPPPSPPKKGKFTFFLQKNLLRFMKHETIKTINTVVLPYAINTYIPTIFILTFLQSNIRFINMKPLQNRKQISTKFDELS